LVNPIYLEPHDTTTVSTRPSEWNKFTVAEYLWKNNQTTISEETLNNVKVASQYLGTQGYQVEGIEADGNCFFSAFLESYKTLTRKIPLLDNEDNKILYLRMAVASYYNNNREEEIKNDREWVDSVEGGKLANHFKIPIRLVTANSGSINAEVSDMLIFPEKDKEDQEWATISENERPREYIFIADVGGHFLWAKRNNT